MTFHVVCPISKKRFDFESIVEVRRFVFAMMKKFPDCDKTIQIKKGKILYAKMWRKGKNVYFRYKGRRKVSTVTETGNLKKKW